MEESFCWLGGPWMSSEESFESFNQQNIQDDNFLEIVLAMGVKTIPFEYQLLMSLEMCPSASTCACFATLMVFFLVA